MVPILLFITKKPMTQGEKGLNFPSSIFYFDLNGSDSMRTAAVPLNYEQLK